MKRIVSELLLTLLLMTLLSLSLNIKTVKSAWSGTVYIRANGNVDPPNAPVVTDDYVTYNLTDDITGGGIVVERDDIIIDGAGFNISNCDVGVDISYRTNVTIKNLNFEYCGQGIYLESSSEINVVENNFRVYDGCCGIYLNNSQNNTIMGNTIVGDYYPGHFPEWQFGIFLRDSHYNDVTSNNLTENLFTIWLNCSSHNRIVGNNITKNYEALRLWYGSNRNIIGSNNVSLNAYGLYVVESDENSIEENTINFNNNTAINFDGSSYNYILKNNIVGNNDGIWLSYSSEHNWILGNNISSNVCGMGFGDASSNIIYHNNFIDNILQVFDSHWSSPWVPASINIWNNTYPSGGNYWSNYTGVDVYSGPYQNETGSDGIGDTPHIIDANNTDYYPLMAPFNTFDAGVWDETVYRVDVVSNSTISNFSFDIDNKCIIFNVSGADGTAGFCRVAIPKSLLWADDRWIILVDDQIVTDYNRFEDENFTYLYFTYNHSTHRVIVQGTNVIPEYPSSIALPLLMLTLLVKTILLKRKNKAAKHYPLFLENYGFCKANSHHSDQKTGKVHVKYGKEKLERSVFVDRPNKEEIERLRIK